MSNVQKHIISGEGERTSFFKLFAENNFRIVIPMLQREYAQGRESAKEVRTEFLKALYTYLDEGIPGRDLDFIYGNIANNDFIPLDGQQRLTTLFLLHWYLSRITSDAELRNQFDSKLLDDTGQHSRFTYKTRTSSSDFCDALMLQNLDLSKLLINKSNKNKSSIKLTIENKNWFHLSWQHDPTIMSMLNMLDAIHEIFNNRADFLPLLLDTERPIITFLFMELDKYHLSDELYIKMNSRGKPLTDFENFKARYSEYIGEKLSSSGCMVSRNRILNDGTILPTALDRYFAERIDNAWVNLIWEYRNDGELDKSMDFGQACDFRMANLVRALLSLKYIELNPQTKGETDPTFALLVNQSGREPLSFLSLREGKALSLENSEFLIDSMDLLCASGNKPKSHLKSDFSHCLSISALMNKILFTPRDLTYNDRVILYAYLGYLLKYGNEEGINQWMRVIFNLANSENNRIDSASEVSNAIRSVCSLLENAPEILKYLTSGERIEAFPSWLIEEERIKASLILRPDGDKWLSKILEAERHGYFNGQIGFMLEFAGIIDYYVNEQNVDWTEEQNETFFDRFVKYSRDSQVVFAENYENRINDVNFRFERAVLFKGDYLPSNNLHYNLLSTSTSKNNVKRDFTWKRLLRLDKDEVATERRSFVKAVFDDPAFDSNNPNECLKNVFAGKSTGEQWRDYLIKYPSAISYCEQGFISFFGDIEGCEGVLPMYSSRLSGYHRELYTWGLYCELQNLPSTPFIKGWGYTEQKVNDELPFLYADGFSIDRRNHWIAITAETNPENWSLIRFRLEFIQDGSHKESESLRKLEDLLHEEGFERHPEGESFQKFIEDDKKVKTFISHLFERLNHFKDSTKNK